jgi:hypothetical protein
MPGAILGDRDAWNLLAFFTDYYVDDFPIRDAGAVYYIKRCFNAFCDERQSEGVRRG